MKCESPRRLNMDSPSPILHLDSPLKACSGALSSSPTSSFSFLPSGPEDSGASSSADMSGSSDENPPDLAVFAASAAEEAKERCVGKNDRVSWGFTSVIGRRREMEDAVAVVPAFMSRACAQVGGCTAPGSRCSDQISPLHFFGVYDGHGGSQVARFCAERMHEVIVEECGRETFEGHEWREKWEAALSNGFERADEEVLRDASANDMVGSTAVVAVVSGCQIILSNCGDSRAVLCRGTQTIPLTVDQKPDREDELARIEGEGGRVINWNGARVLGVLAMSRAIGDHYMRPYIISVPEISFMSRTNEDECLILASDGLWDVLSNDEVGEVARRLLRRRRRSVVTDGPSPTQFVAEYLTHMAIRRNSSDNISVVVVDLKSRRRQQAKQVKMETTDDR